MALENMISEFQPKETKNSEGLATGGGLENEPKNGSNLDLADTPILSNALANGQGLESETNRGSQLNIDEEPEESAGLAKGIGLEALASGDSNLDIDTNPTNSNGLNQTQLGLGVSTLELTNVNDISDGLAK